VERLSELSDEGKLGSNGSLDPAAQLVGFPLSQQSSKLQNQLAQIVALGAEP
jgi:hypothetical protein